MGNVRLTVICLAYNHEKFIKDCLEGFVMQKTNFEFQVIVHDDASTDSTAEIIREYAEKYPDIIKPIYQTENQYSKNLDGGIVKNCVRPYVEGDYIAYCEGDDYWTDENKLQIQVDYMDSHPDCYCTTHTYNIHDFRNDTINPVVRSETDRDFSLKEIVDGGGGLFSTNSFVIRKEVETQMPQCFESDLFGDYQLPMYSAILGKVHYINRNMSVYNYMIQNSWSNKNVGVNDKKVKVTREIYRLLNAIDEHYEYKYHDCFIDEINKNAMLIDFYNEDYKKLKKSEIYKNNNNLLTKKERQIVEIGAVSKGLLKLVFKAKSILRNMRGK